MKKNQPKVDVIIPPAPTTPVVGSVTFSPFSPKIERPVIPASIGPGHPLVGVEPAVEMFCALRKLKQSRAYEAKGFHCFREWAVSEFGERLGGWLDDML